jgi:serine/threonine-protein kinase
MRRGDFTEVAASEGRGLPVAAYGAAQDDPPPPDTAARSLVGRLLCDKWRLERLLGAGGMSSVYAAVHRNGKRVAIKVLRPDLTGNQRVRSRFLREGYIANRVGHEGAVAVLDNDADGDLVFLVMELLEGETLAARARRLGGTLPAEEVAFAVDGLLDILTAAHASGIVHRDVKPQNVFFTRGGGVKLLDFGIASLREISLGFGQTRADTPLGTPGFMAPEQARGRWEEVDARTDLWAVGATMYRLLTGRCVHAGGTANEAMIAAATQAAPSLAGRRADLPAPLIALVDRAIAFEPAQRWQTAREMQEAVRQVRAALPPQGPLRLPPEAQAVDGETLASDQWPAPAATLLRDSAGAPASGSVSPPPASGARRVTWALATIVAAGAIAGAAAWAVRLIPRPQPPGANVAGPPSRPGFPADEAARAYLDEAERLLREQRFGAAGDLVARARALEIADPALTIRLVRLHDDIATATAAAAKAERSGSAAAQRPRVPPVKVAEALPPEEAIAHPEAVAHAELIAPPPAELAPLPEPENTVEPEPAEAAPPPAPTPPPPASPPQAAPVVIARAIDPPLAPRLEAPLLPAPSSGDGRIVSARPKGKIPPPRLPRTYDVQDGQDLARVCQLVERETVAQAGVTPEFASGVTLPLRRALAGAGSVRISLSGIYYFIISEAGRGHDKRTAAQNLRSAYESDIMRKLSSLPVREHKL